MTEKYKARVVVGESRVGNVVGLCLILKFQKKASKEVDNFSITCQVYSIFLLAFVSYWTTNTLFPSTSLSLQQFYDVIYAFEYFEIVTTKACACLSNYQK